MKFGRMISAPVLKGVLIAVMVLVACSQHPRRMAKIQGLHMPQKMEDEQARYKRQEIMLHSISEPVEEPGDIRSPQEGFNTEEYDKIDENPFLEVTKNPVSTFSIDVDAASYSNSRRFINRNHRLPPKDAVRIEEFVNYFTYDYPQPKDEHPFSIITEFSACPWHKDHQLIHIGLQGRKMEAATLPPQNLVFLLDVSGSMNSDDKLGLLKKSFQLLVNNLREQDRVAIAVYAGAAGLVLESTSGDQNKKIMKAIHKLKAGGSTAGGAGIQLAYKVAKDNFIDNGNNRVILGTDGDFNVGVSSTAELERLIEEKRKEGVFLTILGFGMGNYKDSRMETLADKGNGNNYYIDNILEAKKVLVTELTATLFTIAKDVKIQIEFNPAKVHSYRLIGYENRLLAKEDFDDDTKDAGELGAGHTVTALYELIPATGTLPAGDSLKYQQTVVREESFKTTEMMTVKFRYKEPKDTVSKLIVMPVEDKPVDLGQSSENFRFSAAVAGWGLLLRDSKYKEDLTVDQVIKMAEDSQGQDMHRFRDEFISLVKKSKVFLEQRDKN